MLSSLDLSNRVVAISGVSSAFGQAMAELFGAQGAQVFGCDIDNTTFPSLEGLGVTCSAVDLTDRDAATEWIRSIEESGGHVDILVNNAGGVAGQQPVPFEDVSDADWDLLVDINLNAAMALSRACIAGMSKAGGGAIVNICSGASLRASLTGIQAYCAAKHGLLGLTRQLAHELGPKGIRVNAVAPGFVLTGAATHRQWEALGAERQDALLARIALGRIGTPEEIARTALFLASDWASFITGQILSVDGGS